MDNRLSELNSFNNMQKYSNNDDSENRANPAIFTIIGAIFLVVMSWFAWSLGTEIGDAIVDIVSKFN